MHRSGKKLTNFPPPVFEPFGISFKDSAGTFENFASRVYTVHLTEFFVFYIVFTDVHALLVYIVSFLLCVVCFGLLVRAYRRKHQYRKQKKRQRPFLKTKRDSLSPRTSPLFGSLVSFLYNIIIISNDAVSLSKDYRTVESMSCIWISSAFIKSWRQKST